MQHAGNSSCNEQTICDMFADLFQGGYKTDNCDTPEVPDFAVGNVINLPVIDPKDVLDATCALKSSFFPGPDNIPSCVLRNCSEPLANILCYLFNLSIKSSKFPKSWRSSYIMPLFKSGGKHIIDNYRGIAKLSGIPKLFESILSKDLQFKIKHVISAHQHGFCSGKSISTNLLTLTSHISAAFRDKLQTDVGYFDFSKAFDQINHKILLRKLSNYGFSKSYVTWISSYLRGRSQRVLFKSSKSKLINVYSGVPQGSHIGPLLFLLFINDLPLYLEHCDILLYADDAKLYLSHKSSESCDYLQKDFDNMCKWCDINCLNLNIKKCKVMTFCRNNRKIEFQYKLNNVSVDRVDSFVDLGVFFDSKLCFNKHIDVIVGKANCRLGMIKRWSKEFKDPFITKTLFTSLVRSILEFACQVWSPYYQCHINRLESVQKKFLLFALSGLNWRDRLVLPRYEHRLMLLEMNTLSDRRKMLNSMFIFKLLNGSINCTFLLELLFIKCPLRSSRSYVCLKLQFSRLNYLNNEPFSSLCTIFNNLFFIIDYHLKEDCLKRKILQCLRSSMIL